MTHRILIGIFLFVVFQVTAIAETINFNCKGSTTYKSGGIDRGSFDMTVTTSPLDIGGPVGPLGLCHLGEEGENLRKIKFSCEMTESELSCECSGGGFIQKSTHHFSRLTGKLSFVSSLKKDVWIGNYSCKRVNSKLF